MDKGSEHGRERAVKPECGGGTTSYDSLLGHPFRNALARLRASGTPLALQVTRPAGYAFGRGELRVVAVRAEGATPELVLAYEQYGFWPKPDRRPRGADGD